MTALINNHKQEVEAGKRFEFGENWSRFLRLVNEDRILSAESSLKSMLGVSSLAGKTFLDIGSGSGLFSLAARRMGAQVYSFDYDPNSVACTAELRRRYFDGDAGWTVQEASVLDLEYLSRLGKFDIVYSWGVLHHTGDMWRALDNVAPLVAEGGSLFIALYNDQGRASQSWLKVKRLYNALPGMLKFLVLVPCFLRLRLPSIIRDALKGNPLASWKARKNDRGMSPWRDVVDWVGGYPFEVSKPEQIFDFYRQRGFALDKLKTCAGGLGCNEFIFRKL